MAQAVILAGGKATRMRPYTDDRPKAMIEVGGRPIVEHQISWLKANGVDQIVLSCHHKAEVLQNHLGDGSTLGVELSYAIEERPLGRGGGLRFAATHLPSVGSRWFALNGDVITDLTLSEMTGSHERTQALATIALAQYRSSWGIADLHGDLIKGFLEKPALPYWINGGIYLFEWDVVEMLPELGDHEDSTFPDLAKRSKLAGFRIDGYWKGIDNAKDIQEANDYLEGMR